MMRDLNISLLSSISIEIQESTTMPTFYSEDIELFRYVSKRMGRTAVHRITNEELGINHRNDTSPLMVALLQRVIDTRGGSPQVVQIPNYPFYQVVALAASQPALFGPLHTEINGTLIQEPGIGLYEQTERYNCSNAYRHAIPGFK
jgi:hypothetical protein